MKRRTFDCLGRVRSGIILDSGGTESGTNALVRLFSPFCTATIHTAYNGPWL